MSMELTEQTAKDLDRMLHLLTNNPHGAYDAHELQTTLFREYDTNYVQGFVDFLLSYGRNLVMDVGNLGMLQLGTSTTFFLKNGGFIKILKIQREEKEEEKDLRKLVRQEVVLNIDKLINENIDYAKTKNRSKRSEIYAVTAIVISVIAIILPLVCNKHS
jgi:hypothetical protein